MSQFEAKVLIDACKTKPEIQKQLSDCCCELKQKIDKCCCEVKDRVREESCDTRALLQAQQVDALRSELEGKKMELLMCGIKGGKK